MGFQLLLDVCRITEWWMKPNGWLVSAGVWSADEVLRMLWIHFLISVLALFFESFQSRMVLLIACVFFLEKALYNWVEAEDFGGFFFTHLQGGMVSYMWMSWRVCLIVRESGIGWNHWKSVLCQIVRGFLIGCHWQSTIPLTVRESLIGYEFLFLFMLPMNKVISGTRQITICLWCHQNL